MAAGWYKLTAVHYVAIHCLR